MRNQYNYPFLFAHVIKLQHFKKAQGRGGEQANGNSSQVYGTRTEVSLAFSPFSFGRGVKGPGRSHVKKQHSTAVRITVIIYTIMTKLNKTVKERKPAAG